MSQVLCQSPERGRELAGCRSAIGKLLRRAEVLSNQLQREKAISSILERLSLGASLGVLWGVLESGPDPRAEARAKKKKKKKAWMHGWGEL